VQILVITRQKIRHLGFFYWCQNIRKHSEKVRSSLLHSVLYPAINGCTCVNVLHLLNLHAGHGIKRWTWRSFLFSCPFGSTTCPQLTDIIGLRFPTANFRNFLCFMLVYPSQNVPESDARCTNAVNSACTNFDVLRRQIITISQA